MNVPQLPDDVVKHILGYLPHQLLLNNKRVCKRWQRIINDWRFLTSQFPVFKCSNLPLRKTAQIVADMNAHKELSKVSFKSGHKGEMFLETLDVKFQKLTINQDALSADETPTNKKIGILMSKLKSPASLSLKNLYWHNVLQVLRNCVENNIVVEKLKLRKISCKSYLGQAELRSGFNTFARNVLFKSPFHLDLGDEDWVDHVNISSLANRGVIFSFIAAKKIESTNTSLLTTQLTTPCDLLHRSPVYDGFMTCVIARNLKLRRIDMSYISEDTICTLFESHLTSPCKVSFLPIDITPKILATITLKNIIFEKLRLRHEFGSSPKDDALKAWAAFFSENRIKALSIENPIFMEPKFFACFPKTELSDNRLQKLKIGKIDIESFALIAKSSLCTGNQFSLSVAGLKLPLFAINLLVKSNLKFKKLRYTPGEQVEYSIFPLVENGSLDNCEKLFLYFRCVDQYISLKALSKRNTSLKTLQFSLFGAAQEITDLLANPKAFPLLNRLKVIGALSEWRPLVMKIQATRPGIVVEYTDEQYSTASIG